MVQVKAVSGFPRRYRRRSNPSRIDGYWKALELFGRCCGVAALLTLSFWLHSMVSHLLFPPSSMEDVANAVRATLAPSSSSSSSSNRKDPTAYQTRMEEWKAKLELEDRIWREQARKALAYRATNPYDPARSTKGLDSQAAILRHAWVGIREVPSNPRYQAQHVWQQGAGSFPELNVVGNLKTGTSQLYNLLATHQQVANQGKDWKEHCLADHYGAKNGVEDTYEYALYQWHHYYYQRKQQLPEPLPIVNGCLMLQDLEMRWAYAPPTPQANPKFLVLLRDPADWAWAAYNFFCDPSWERYDATDNWVQPGLHYRSPEVFHELVLSGDKLLGTELLRELKVHSTIKLRRLRELVGPENLLVLKNEDLLPHRILSSGALEKISKLTGLSVDGFDEETLGSRSNCNANKGFANKCADETDDDGMPNPRGYPVTEDRPMLEASRRFIYLQWHEECQVWAKEFGIVYQDCLSVLDGAEEYVEQDGPYDLEAEGDNEY